MALPKMTDKELQELLESTDKWLNSPEGKATMKQCFKDIAKREKEREQQERDSSARMARMMHTRITI